MTNRFQIRTAIPADLARIDRLLGQSYPILLKNAYPPSVLVTAIPLISKANPKLLASNSYFVIENSEGAFLGAGGWTSSDPTTGQKGAPSTGHIRHFVTDHQHTRQGLGRALMGHIVEGARAFGITRLDCMSTLAAIPFYSACGFSETRAVTLELRPGIDFPAMAMQREI